MALTFRGGVHVNEYKNTAGKAAETMPAPSRVFIPLSQHIGSPCAPLVAPGDYVLCGQKIGETEGLGCPVHSSVSGKVVSIRERNTATGAKNREIEIENDGSYTLSGEIRPADRPLSSYTPDDIIAVVREAGIAGMGGATFPTYAKIKSAVGKVDRLIINCAECEPFITANHRLMLEKPEEIINGAKILLRAFSLHSAEIAVEDNKLDGARALDAAADGSELIRIRILKTKYPQGDERQLIYAVTGREMPQGKLPADVGCVVFNAETCAAVFRAFAYGMPSIERRVTVDGDCIGEPKNLIVRIGTPVSAVIDYCGGFVKQPEKIIIGGPMMGFAQWDIDTPVVKGCSAVLAFSADFCADDPDGKAECIRCGRCVAGCPMHLMPSLLATFSKAGDYDSAEKDGIMSCVECGSCSYVCPAHVPIVQYIRLAKFKIKTKSRPKTV